MIDFERLFDDFSIRYWTSGKNVSKGWVNITCPICGDESNHGGFNIESGQYHCWKCGKHDFVYVLQLLLHKNRNEIILIIDRYSSYRSRLIDINKESNYKELDFIGYELKKIHIDYLIKRNFNPNYIIGKYKVTGFTFENSYWKYRLMIPIFYNYKIVNYVGRDVTGKQERYLNMKNEDAVIGLKNTLYNLDNAAKEDKVIVVEGIFDVWRGGDGFVATFGISFTKKQILHLLEFDRIYIMFDCEDAVQEKAKELGKILSGFSKKVSVIDLQLRDKDFADLSPEEVKDIKKALK